MRVTHDTHRAEGKSNDSSRKGKQKEYAPTFTHITPEWERRPARDYCS